MKEVIGEIGSENEPVVEGQGNLDSALTSVSEENSGEAVKENESNTQTEEEQQENRSDVQAEEQQESESNIQSEEQQENGANVQAEEQQENGSNVQSEEQQENESNAQTEEQQKETTASDEELIQTVDDLVKLSKKPAQEYQSMREYPHLIFTTTSGNCLTPGTLAVECRRICSVVNRKNREVEGCKEYEEIKIYPHLFRHTFVTRCYEAGVDPMTIALIVGHSREKMVNHYTHISKEFQKKDFVKYEEQEKERILSDSE